MYISKEQAYETNTPCLQKKDAYIDIRISPKVPMLEAHAITVYFSFFFEKAILVRFLNCQRYEQIRG